MKLVDDWKQCHKWFTQQSNAIAGAVAMTYATMYDNLKENFPPKVMMCVVGGVFFVNIFLRVIDQGKKK